MHILVSSDMVGDNIAIEAILKDNTKLAQVIDIGSSVGGEWYKHYPDRKLEDVRLHDIFIPQDKLSVLVSSCRGWESGDICSVMGDSSSFARDSVVD